MAGSDKLLLLEMVVMCAVIVVIPYTEIDWKAYMDEVSGVINGELDYRHLRGETGPLVYPAGFVWLYSALYYLTRQGQDIAVAQWLFYGVYMATLALVFILYRRTGCGAARVLLPLLVSKRIRSLYALRLFNDCWAMMLLYGAIVAMAVKRRWELGCLLYSMAVSIKMNIFLFAPGLLYVLLRSLPLSKVVLCLGVCAAWQVFAGLPFLLSAPDAYLSKAFELSRVFTFKWSVNFQFLPEQIFVDPRLGLALLAMTLVSWLLLWRLRWRHRIYDENAVAALDAPAADAELNDPTATAIILTMLESNMVGVIFSRSLHYQFLTWFYHGVPLLLHFTRFPKLLRMGSFVLMRQGFENYPPTPRTSALLMSGFALCLVGILFFGREPGQHATPRAAASDREDKLTSGTALNPPQPVVTSRLKRNRKEE